MASELDLVSKSILPLVINLRQYALSSPVFVT